MIKLEDISDWKPSFPHACSIFFGILGVSFTLTSYTLPGLTFDSLSIISGVIAAFRKEEQEKV